MGTKRLLFILIAILCILSLGYAYFVQYYNHIEPCPLCIAERVIIGIVVILALMFALFTAKGFVARISGLVIGAWAGFGIKTAMHHLWLMNLPPDKQPQSCGMPLEILYKRIPLNNFISYILKGDGECGKVTWTILGMSAPTALIVFYSVIALISIYIIFAGDKKTERRFL